MLARLALACLLLACGPAEPAASTPAAPDRAADPLDGVATEVRVRPVCGDPHEGHIRRLVPTTFACSDTARTGYVVSRTEAGLLLVVAGREPIAGTPRSRLVTAFVLDGAAVDTLPATTGVTPLDRDALFLAAVFAEHDDPDVALDGPDADALLDERATLYLSDRPRVLADATHAAGIGRAETDDGYHELTLTHYDVNVSATGALVVTHEPLYRQTPTSTRVHGLRERTAAVPFDTVSRPRPLCGDVQEAAIRLRLRTVPSCDGAPDTVYVAGHGFRLVGDDYRRVPIDFAVAQWGDPDRGELQGLVGDVIAAAFHGDLSATTGEDRLAALMGGLLARRRATQFAMDRDAISSTLDRASRARLARIAVGLTPVPVLRAVGWSTTDEGDTRLERYEVDFWDTGFVRFRAWDLEPGGRETESTAPGPDDPIPALSGL